MRWFVYYYFIGTISNLRGTPLNGFCFHLSIFVSMFAFCPLAVPSEASSSTHEHWKYLAWINSSHSSSHLLSIDCKAIFLRNSSHPAHIRKASHILETSLMKSWVSLSVSIILNSARVIKLLLFRVRQDSLCLVYISEFLRSIILLYLRLTSISIRMIFQSHFFICLLDLFISGFLLDIQNAVIILFLCLFFFLLSLLYFCFQIYFWIKLLYFGVILNCSWVFTSLHVDLCSSHVWL